MAGLLVSGFWWIGIRRMSRISARFISVYRRRVSFFSTVELVDALEEEIAQGKSGQIANRLVHSDLVILDELGYLPFNVFGACCVRIA